MSAGTDLSHSECFLLDVLRTDGSEGLIQSDRNDKSSWMSFQNDVLSATYDSGQRESEDISSHMPCRDQTDLDMCNNNSGSLGWSGREWNCSHGNGPDGWLQSQQIYNLYQGECVQNTCSRDNSGSANENTWPRVSAIRCEDTDANSNTIQDDQEAHGWTGMQSMFPDIWSVPGGGRAMESVFGGAILPIGEETTDGKYNHGVTFPGSEFVYISSGSDIAKTYLPDGIGFDSTRTDFSVANGNRPESEIIDTCASSNNVVSRERRTDFGQEQAVAGTENVVGRIPTDHQTAEWDKQAVAGTENVVGRIPTDHQTAEWDKQAVAGTENVVGRIPTDHQTAEWDKQAVAGTENVVGRIPTDHQTAEWDKQAVAGTENVVGRIPTDHQTAEWDKQAVAGTENVVGRIPTDHQTAEWDKQAVAGTENVVGRIPTDHQTAQWDKQAVVGTENVVGRIPTDHQTAQWDKQAVPVDSNARLKYGDAVVGDADSAVDGHDTECRLQKCGKQEAHSNSTLQVANLSPCSERDISDWYHGVDVSDSQSHTRMWEKSVHDENMEISQTEACDIATNESVFQGPQGTDLSGGKADSVQRKAPLVVCKRDAADNIYSVEMKEPSTSVQSDGEQICVKSMASDRESYTKNGSSDTGILFTSGANRTELDVKTADADKQNAFTMAKLDCKKTELDVKTADPDKQRAFTTAKLDCKKTELDVNTADPDKQKAFATAKLDCKKTELDSERGKLWDSLFSRTESGNKTAQKLTTTPASLDDLSDRLSSLQINTQELSSVCEVSSNQKILRSSLSQCGLGNPLGGVQNLVINSEDTHSRCHQDRSDESLKNAYSEHREDRGTLGPVTSRQSPHPLQLNPCSLKPPSSVPAELSQEFGSRSKIISNFELQDKELGQLSDIKHETTGCLAEGIENLPFGGLKNPTVPKSGVLTDTGFTAGPSVNRDAAKSSALSQPSTAGPSVNRDAAKSSALSQHSTAGLSVNRDAAKSSALLQHSTAGLSVNRDAAKSSALLQHSTAGLSVNRDAAKSSALSQHSTAGLSVNRDAAKSSALSQPSTAGLSVNRDAAKSSALSQPSTAGLSVNRDAAKSSALLQHSTAGLSVNRDAAKSSALSQPSTAGLSVNRDAAKSSALLQHSTAGLSVNRDAAKSSALSQPSTAGLSVNRDAAKSSALSQPSTAGLSVNRDAAKSSALSQPSTAGLSVNRDAAKSSALLQHSTAGLSVNRDAAKSSALLQHSTAGLSVNRDAAKSSALSQPSTAGLSVNRDAAKSSALSQPSTAGLSVNRDAAKSSALSQPSTAGLSVNRDAAKSSALLQHSTAGLSVNRDAAKSSALSQPSTAGLSVNRDAAKSSALLQHSTAGLSVNRDAAKSSALSQPSTAGLSVNRDAAKSSALSQPSTAGLSVNRDAAKSSALSQPSTAGLSVNRDAAKSSALSQPSTASKKTNLMTTYNDGQKPGMDLKKEQIHSEYEQSDASDARPVSCGNELELRPEQKSWPSKLDSNKKFQSTYSNERESNSGTDLVEREADNDKSGTDQLMLEATGGDIGNQGRFLLHTWI